MYCILVTGIPASGKSTIAKYLSEYFRIPVISKDEIKEQMYDTVGFRSREEKVNLGIASMNIMYYMAEQLMKCGQPFILENNFENVSKEGLAAILERYSYQAITVTLTGDYRIIYQRFLKRNSSPDRHRGHVVNDCYPEKAKNTKIPPISYEDFVAGIIDRGMDSFAANGPHIILDTTDFAQIDKDRLLQEIIPYRTKSAMDIELFYQEKGTGYPLLLLHGNGENHEYFKAQMDYFSAFYRTIAIDTRGHGDSPRGSAPFTISQFADDLYAFMGLHGIEKANILGFSDGGNIALVFSMRYPDKVNRLILNGANLYSSGVKPTVQLPIIAGYHTASFFAKRSSAAKAHAEMLGLMVNDPALTENDLKQVKCKTLVIAGTRDMIKQKHTEKIHKGIKGSELAILEGDHFIANKHPDAFNRAVHDFLTQK